MCRSRPTSGPSSRPRASCVPTRRPRPSPMTTGSPRIDSHHHFWAPARTSYPWMVGDALDPIRKPFGPADLVPELAAQGVSGTILVQTVSSLEETREFLALAAAREFIWGVVGWVDLTSAAVGDELDALRDGPGGDRLVGGPHHGPHENQPGRLRRADGPRGRAAGG